MSAADERETESEVASVREALDGYRHESTKTTALPAFPIIQMLVQINREFRNLIFLGLLSACEDRMEGDEEDEVKISYQLGRIFF